MLKILQISIIITATFARVMTFLIIKVIGLFMDIRVETSE